MVFSYSGITDLISPCIELYEYSRLSMLSDSIWLHVRSVGNWTNALYDYYKQKGIAPNPLHKDGGRGKSVFPYYLRSTGVTNLRFLSHLIFQRISNDHHYL